MQRSLGGEKMSKWTVECGDCHLKNVIGLRLLLAGVLSAAMPDKAVEVHLRNGNESGLRCAGLGNA